MNITPEMVEAALTAALKRHVEWRQETAEQVFTNTSALVEATARAAVEAVAPLIAAQALRSAADDHASYDEDQVDYVGHEDRCDYGPPPCDCAKGRTARWLYRRAGKLEGRT